jgi:hypothetical protein
VRPFILSRSACLSLALAAAAAACGGSSAGTGFAGPGGNGDGGGPAGPAGGDGGATPPPPLLGGDAAFVDGGGNANCPLETQYVYVIDVTGTLYRFDPPALTFTTVGTLACPSISSPYSMAVDRNGQAWVVFQDGNLFQVDTKTAGCKATSYSPGQHGFLTFGMGFSTDAPGGTAETLYVSDSGQQPDGTYQPTKGLAKLDTATLALTPIAAYDAITARAEMTGTGDARLFGAFEGSPYVVAQIQKTDAKILSQAPQSTINYAPDMSNFAFAFWGGDFWLFVGPGTSTDVFDYSPSAGTTKKVKTVSFEIVGAGVSTCAPTTPPK